MIRYSDTNALIQTDLGWLFAQSVSQESSHVTEVRNTVFELLMPRFETRFGASDSGFESLHGYDNLSLKIVPQKLIYLFFFNSISSCLSTLSHHTLNILFFISHTCFLHLIYMIIKPRIYLLNLM